MAGKVGECGGDGDDEELTKPLEEEVMVMVMVMVIHVQALTH